MSQQSRILNFLLGGGTLTRIDAWNKLGILEAPARISELRTAGHKIRTEMVTVYNRYQEPVKVARWTYPTTIADEIRYLIDKRVRLTGEQQQATDEKDWIKANVVAGTIKAIDESLRSLRAFRGAAA